MIDLKKLALLGLLIPIIFISSIAYSKPYCALRDPTVQVYELFPVATSYKSIVHTVSKDVREKILDILPFTIHAKEIGEHTVYAALTLKRTLGLVHVRSELGHWGLLEIAWAIDLDGKIIDFTFQRCREDSCGQIDSVDFRQQLLGMELADLTDLMNKDGSELLEGKLNVSPEARELALSVIRSAMKTIVVTQMVWGEDIEALKADSPLTIFSQ